tara:strand:- start:2961 stop:3557 length:597 start_codon:yes stop_codon:yes gene_type:complete
MNFEINLNESNGSDSLIEGWLQYTAIGTRDGQVPAQSFYVNQDGEKKVCATIKKTGVIMDIYEMRSGWQRFADGSSEWAWNPNLVTWIARPGDDWKKGIEIPCCINEKLYMWRQSGTAVIEGMRSIQQALNGKADGKLPVVKMTGATELKFKKGTSTFAPEFEVVEFVDRPFVLEAKQAGVPQVEISAEDSDMEVAEF